MSEPYHPSSTNERPVAEAWPPPVYAVQPPGLPYDRDGDHLRLLSIFYYIWGAMTIVFSCLLLFDFYLGMTMLSHPLPAQVRGVPGPGMPPNMATPAGAMRSTAEILEIIGGGGTTLGWIMGGLTLYAGRCLATHRHPVFIMVIAALNCLSIPLGTILGVFTFVVTARPTVKALFVQR